MFVFKKEVEVIWPVSINMPLDNGTTRKIKTSAKFKVLPQSEINDLTNRGMLEKAVVGWPQNAFVTKVGPNEGDVEDIPFSADTLAALLDVTYIFAGFYEAYQQVLAGHRAKN